MTEQASQFIGSIPEHYDRSLGPRLFHGFADDLAARAIRGETATVLELAAGTGIVSRRLRDAMAAESILLVTDLNAPMLEVAATKFSAEESVEFLPADATDLPCEDASFDAVVCQFGVMFFPDKQSSYEEALRVLKPGGRYLFNTWGSWEQNPFARIANDTVSGFFPDDPPGFYKVPFGYHQPEQIEQALLAAGFAQVLVEVLISESEIPSVSDFATGLVFGNPLFDEVVARGGDPELVRDAIARALESELGGNLSLQALVIEAHKS